MNGLCARQHRDEGRDLLGPTFTRRHRAGAKYERKLVLFVERGERLPRTRACVYGGAQVSGDGRRVHVALRGIGRVPTAVGSEYRKTDCERVGVSRCGGGRSAMGGGSVGSGGYGTTRARRARVRQRTSLLLLSLVLVWGACGSDSPANTGTGGASATGGGAGTQSGSGGATGGASAGRGGAAGDAPGGRGGGGGAQTATCPTVPPQSGTNCTIGLNCYYEDCAGVGVTNATCVAGVSAPRWVVTTSACTTVVCPNPSTMMCPAGQICVVRAGGAISTECVSNSCGTSAISCDCLQSCSGDCTVLGTSVGSVAIYCNTCPQATCP